ncbi:fetuin-B-like [Tiliqua scincoides]|uniref:fetuin-B-like n=1 Tax=Tiliqua scincoides TaxID=71010 RepID=UPI0034633057
MVLLISLLVGIQVVSAWAGYPSSNPELLQPPILSLACNSSMAEAAADLTLQKINTDRREGYVFSLQRIFGVSEIPLINNISNFFLTLDVLETECHVWSRKPYQNCSIRPQHETVYGQCKASVLIDWRRKISHLYNYECVLRPIAPADIARVCPDCPVPGDPTAVRFLKAATKSLAKFNAENNHLHYFRVLNVTKGRSQWVFGPQTVMEYTIRETSCSKRAPVPDVSKCPFLPLEIADLLAILAHTVGADMHHNRYLLPSTVYQLSRQEVGHRGFKGADAFPESLELLARRAHP